MKFERYVTKNEHPPNSKTTKKDCIILFNIFLNTIIFTYSAVLLQGSEVTKVFLQEGQDVLFTEINKMDEIECELDIKIGAEKKPILSVVSVVELEHSKPLWSRKKSLLKSVSIKIGQIS